MANIRATGKLNKRTPPPQTRYTTTTVEEKQEEKVYLGRSKGEQLVKDLEKEGYIIERDSTGKVQKIYKKPTKYVASYDKKGNPTATEEYTPTEYYFQSGNLRGVQNWELTPTVKGGKQFNLKRPTSYEAYDPASNTVTTSINPPRSQDPAIAYQKAREKEKDARREGIYSVELAGVTYRSNSKELLEQRAEAFRREQERRARLLIDQQNKQGSQKQQAAIFPQPKEYYDNKSIDLEGMNKEKGKQIINTTGLDTTFKYGGTSQAAPEYKQPQLVPNFVIESAKREAELLGVRPEYIVTMRETGGYKGTSTGLKWNLATEREITKAQQTEGLESVKHYYYAFGGQQLETYTQDPKKTAAYVGIGLTTGFGSAAIVRSGVISAGTLLTVSRAATGIYAGSILYGTIKAEDTEARVKFLGKRAAETVLFVGGAAAGQGLHTAYVKASNWKAFNYDIKRDYVDKGEIWRGGDTVYEPKYQYTIANTRTGKITKVSKLYPQKPGIPIVEKGTGAVLKGQQLQIKPKSFDIYEGSIKTTTGKTYTPSGQKYFSRSGLEAKGISITTKAQKVPGTIAEVPKAKDYQTKIFESVKLKEGKLEIKPYTEGSYLELDTFQATPKRSLKPLLRSKKGSISISKSELQPGYQEDYLYPKSQIQTPEATIIEGITPAVKSLGDSFPVFLPYSTQKKDTYLGYKIDTDLKIEDRSAAAQINKPIEKIDLDINQNIIIKQDSSQIPKVRQKQEQLQEQILIPFYKTVTTQKTIETVNPSIEIAEIPDPELPPPPPEFKKGFGFGEKKKGGQYTLLVRREGSFKPIGQKQDLVSALKLGKKIISTTAAASFKITGGSFGDIQQASRNILSDKQFYTSKKDRSIFIEKKEKRIKSAGELGEITFKGLSTIKRKRKSRGFSIF